MEKEKKSQEFLMSKRTENSRRIDQYKKKTPKVFLIQRCFSSLFTHCKLQVVTFIFPIVYSALPFWYCLYFFFPFFSFVVIIPMASSSLAWPPPPTTFTTITTTR